MNSSQIKREQVSALIDGELDGARASRILGQMADPELRAAWDRYHQIGDALRSEEMAAPLSTDFNARFADRLAAEPSPLAPKRSLLTRLGIWPTALAAAAAAGVGFFIAPGMVSDRAQHDGGVVLVADNTGAPQANALAAASGLTAVAHADVADYIRLHQSANPALYGATPLARPIVFDDSGKH